MMANLICVGLMVIIILTPIMADANADASADPRITLDQMMSSEHLDSPSAPASPEPKASPKTAPEASPKTAPKASPKTAPKPTPETAPEPTPETEPKPTPKISPKLPPKTVPKPTPETTPGPPKPAPEPPKPAQELPKPAPEPAKPAPEPQSAPEPPKHAPEPSKPAPEPPKPAPEPQSAPELTKPAQGPPSPEPSSAPHERSERICNGYPTYTNGNKLRGVSQDYDASDQVIAEVKCQLEGARLVHIYNAEMSADIREVMNEIGGYAQRYYYGLKQLDGTHYQWSDGATFTINKATGASLDGTYTNFDSPSGHDGDGDDDSTCIYNSPEAADLSKWSDVDCTIEMGYICECHEE